MKLLLSLVVAILTLTVLASRPTISLEAMDWSTRTNLGFIVFQVATSKDLLVYNDASGATPVTAIRRRNSAGIYEPVANFTISASPFSTTNGKWVALHMSMIKSLVLFKIDENNQLAELQFSNVAGIGGYLLSDDTLVSCSNVYNNGTTIYSYQYEASNNTWINIPGTEVDITGASGFGDSLTYRATDTHMVVFNSAAAESDLKVDIYERQVDLSWKFTDTVPINDTLKDGDGSPNYNGIDTLIYAKSEHSENGTYNGLVIVFTRSNNKWIEQRFTTESVGYRPAGYLGYATLFLDADTILVTAGLEGVTQLNIDSTAGKILLLTRNATGLWVPAADIIGADLFAFGVGANDYDVIAPALVFDQTLPPKLQFYTAPRCSLQQINVTCHDQQVSDCSNLVTTDLYTINDDAQCGNVTVSIGSQSLVNNQTVQIQLNFARSFRSTSCDVTVTCPAPPSVVTQTPSKTSGSSGNFPRSFLLLIGAIFWLFY